MTAVGRLAAAVEAAHARLESAGLRHRTYGLLDLAAGEDNLKPPYVAVVPLGETAGGDLAGGGADLTGALEGEDRWGRSEAALHAPSPTVQRVEATLGVVCCVAARAKPLMRQLDDDAEPRRDGGAGADAQLEALIAAVRERLLGWIPSPAWGPLTLARGRLLSAQDGRAHWQDEFRSWYLASGGGADVPATPEATELCVAVNGAAPGPVEVG